jgi:hypothetical protein
LAEAGAAASPAESKTTKTKGTLIVVPSTDGWIGCVADENCARSSVAR